MEVGEGEGLGVGEGGLRVEEGLGVGEGEGLGVGEGQGWGKRKGRKQECLEERVGGEQGEELVAPPPPSLHSLLRFFPHPVPPISTPCH